MAFGKWCGYLPWLVWSVGATTEAAKRQLPPPVSVMLANQKRAAAHVKAGASSAARDPDHMQECDVFDPFDDGPVSSRGRDSRDGAAGRHSDGGRVAAAAVGGLDDSFADDDDDIDNPATNDVDGYDNDGYDHESEDVISGKLCYICYEARRKSRRVSSSPVVVACRRRL